MRIAILTPGTGSYYCGACMRDNALAKSLHAAGHEVSLLPMYLPLQLDEDQHLQADNPIFFGGINVFLQQKIPFFKTAPRWLHKLLNHSGLLRSAAKRSHMTSAREHGEMALAMLRIEDSNFDAELDKLIDWLANEKPEILCLGTALQAGMIRELKNRLGVKIICSFQGEDSFLDGLPEPFKSECWAELRERLGEADLLVSPSQFYADLMRDRLESPDLRIEVLPNGIDLEGYRSAAPADSPPVIGYLARMIREKGVHDLVEAFIHLRTKLNHPDARLHIAGATTAGDLALVEELKQQLHEVGLSDHVTWSPNLSREAKAEMLASLTLFSVPATYPEAFGLYLVEALASGVPVVQPHASSFPEIITPHEAGLLVPPDDPIALATAWHELLQSPDDLQTYRKNSRQAAERSYSVSAMRDRFLELATPLVS
ncbi:glycosyl transferase family 1 [Haloferula helveola]|uniref:Glycosyl transferase family 1 n=1 Tax=Haloferula helveola TaxID=490095 RepID=A0ABM7RHZ6_9BACT|nr:glycosyl transferase family 1 [Haloferula helveola]